MISNDIKVSMKKAARRSTFRWFMFYALIISFFGTVGSLDGQPPIEVIGQKFVMWFVPVAFIMFLWSRGNPSKKLYLKSMQKHIMGELANADDPILIQKLGVAMTYYGNVMNEVQMAEVKAAAASRSHTHSHSYEYRNY